MAKNYRTILFDMSANLGDLGNPTKICDIEPIDSQQSLGSYLSNVKVSVIQDFMTGNNRLPFMIYASSDNTSLGVNDVITAGATGTGGGTVNLSLKRKILDSEDDPSRSDGPVSIWLETCNVDGSEQDAIVTVVVEAWGRFVEVTQ